MRKTLIIVAAAALALVPVTAAQASTKQYKISYAVSPAVIDVSPNHSDRATVSGRVTGGPVKGRSVHLYATNTNAPGSKRVDLHTVSLSSSGRFTKSWHPPRGGRWVFTVSRPTYGSYRGTTVATKSVDAFEFVDISRFYQSGRNNLPAAATPLVGTVPGHVERLKVAGGTLNFGVEYFVQGGASAVFDVSGYRCKKLSMHLGISSASQASAGTYETMLDTTRLASYSGSRAKSDNEQTGTYTVTGHFNKVTIQVAPPTSVRVLVGNPKVFCTYPFS